MPPTSDNKEHQPVDVEEVGVSHKKIKKINKLGRASNLQDSTVEESKIMGDAGVGSKLNR